MPPTDQIPNGRPRWILHLQAQFWRVLMSIGMALHKLARPRPPRPSFHRDVDASVSPLKGKFRIHFYTPRGYKRQRKLKGGKRYPVVINFHGGGFVLGTPYDDARWCGCVVDQVGAVVVSVAYRLAPEFPFPTAVEDGADAILYLSQHADELMLDPERFAVTGFSSGGNMSFTVPLCLQGELFDRTASGANIVDGRAGSVPAAVVKPPPAVVLGNGAAPGAASQPGSRFASLTKINLGGSTADVRLQPTSTQDTTHLHPTSAIDFHPPPSTTQDTHLHPSTASTAPQRIPLSRHNTRIDRIAMLRQTGTSTLSLVSSYKSGPAVSVMTADNPAVIKIRGIVSFYPPTDYTQTRAQRRATCARTDHQLPAVFTQLFDDSYLQPPSLDLAHPWLSPGVAPQRMLAALPDDIVLFTCEWDMLLAEGERFRNRLQNELGKRVAYHMVPGVPHGWDKAPNPLRESPGARTQYGVACRELKRMFDIDGEDGEDRESAEVKRGGEEV